MKLLTVKPNRKIKYFTDETINKVSVRTKYSGVIYPNTPAKDRAFYRARLKAELARECPSKDMLAHRKLISDYGSGINFALSMVALIQEDTSEEYSPKVSVISDLQTEQVS